MVKIDIQKETEVIEKAMKECDKVGIKNFSKSGNFKKPTKYLVVSKYSGRLYPLKPIYGHIYSLNSDECNASAVKKWFQARNYIVEYIINLDENINIQDDINLYSKYTYDELKAKIQKEPKKNFSKNYKDLWIY